MKPKKIPNLSKIVFPIAPILEKRSEWEIERDRFEPICFSYFHQSVFLPDSE
ncbi:hypothetical protein M5D10_05120 [Leptospira santarosai]|uniref:hypothetical protein n=1 Tax=Leptospira santarosai TaxID=28183 RepID=UPI000AD3FC9B|nr:hypothetical protein [Leptospira santarosai]UZN08343.1 hypothetical protein M5D10_05120 [Leptospira santarosai]